MSNIKFDIATEQDNINFGHKAQSAAYVDEEGLLPGAEEARETTGMLPLTANQKAGVEIQFEGVDTQHALAQLGLTSKSLPLNYELAHNNHLLIATAGTTNIAVFTAYLDNNGTYSFTLHNHIDRKAPPNLIHNAHTNETNEAENLGWTSSKTSVYQEIATQAQAPYLLTFHYQPNLNPQNTGKEIQVFWGEKLLYSLLPNQLESKGYTFSVEGLANHEATKLQFTSEGIHNQFDQIIQNVSVTSAAQNKLPIPLCYNIMDSEGHVSHDQFTINVTTTPPIQVSNTEPFDVIYDQGVYQTIIVQAESLNHATARTTINIDNLFKNLAICAENRLVEIVQREEHGHRTNVYEVQISDKSQPTLPITIADVQLSFPGGDGGLSVFHRHIAIEEGTGGLLPPADQHFT